MAKRHTYDYGLIGNCSFQAHINKNTSIDWMCWPRFDRSFNFGKLLDEENGGAFTLFPHGEIKESHQHYLENTNILCTEITCEEGKYRVIDFAPRFYQFDGVYLSLLYIDTI